MEDILLLGKFVSQLHRREQRYIGHIMREYGVGTSGYLFLICLLGRGEATQRSLCRHLFMDEALATRTVRQLAQRGYLDRKQDPRDGRSYLLSLTESGKELTLKLREELSGWWEQVTHSLAPEQREGLLSGLEQLVERAGEVNHALHGEKKDKQEGIKWNR